MDLPAWKNKVHERLQAFARQVNKNTPGMLYAARNAPNAGDLLWTYITQRLGASLQEFGSLLKWHLLEAGI